MTRLDHSLPIPTPRWFAPLGLLALLWNLFGVVQFVSSLRDTQESLVRMGMTPGQAEVYASYPAWMSAAFGLGVFAGLVGSVVLLLRRKLATPLFALSLLGYIVLFIGDVTEGVFAALGAKQVAILSTVVAIAAALLQLSRRFERAGNLA